MTALGFALVLAAGGAAAADEHDALRAEVARPLQTAQELVKQHKFAEALAKLHDAEAVPGRTAYETSVLEQIRLVAAIGAGQPALAAKSFDAIAAAPRLSAAEQLNLLQAIAVSFYQQKDYAAAAAWGGRYLGQGGGDGQVRVLVAQAAFLGNDFATAVKLLQQQVKAEEAGGHAAAEGHLQLLANAYLKQSDEAGYAATLEKLVAAYPKADYWADLLYRLASRPGFPGRLTLDLDRLRLATGTLNGAGQYVDMAELALQGGLPGEAKTVIDRGFTAGLLGSGADAARHRRLQDLAARSAAEDRKTLEATEHEAAAKPDGGALVAAGLDHLGYGEADRAAELLSQGIAKGGLKHPDDALLHLGIAYLAAKRTDKALDAFRSVGSTDGTADLARLWSLHAKSL